MVLRVEDRPQLHRCNGRGAPHTLDFPRCHVEASLVIGARLKGHAWTADHSHGLDQAPEACSEEPRHDQPEAQREHHDPPTLQPVLVEAAEVQDPGLQRQQMKGVGPEHRAHERPAIAPHLVGNRRAEAPLDLPVTASVSVQEMQHGEGRRQLPRTKLQPALSASLVSVASAVERVAIGASSPLCLIPLGRAVKPSAVRGSLPFAGPLQVRLRNRVSVVLDDQARRASLQ